MSGVAVIDFFQTNNRNHGSDGRGDDDRDRGRHVSAGNGTNERHSPETRDGRREEIVPVARKQTGNNMVQRHTHNAPPRSGHQGTALLTIYEIPVHNFR